MKLKFHIFWDVTVSLNKQFPVFPRITVPSSWKHQEMLTHNTLPRSHSSRSDCSAHCKNFRCTCLSLSHIQNKILFTLLLFFATEVQQIQNRGIIHSVYSSPYSVQLHMHFNETYFLHAQTSKYNRNSKLHNSWTDQFRIWRRDGVTQLACKQEK
jgi:hypothetical protein